MSNKSGNLFTFLTGAAIGAAAVFLSKKQNRDKAQKSLEEAREQIAKLKKQYHSDPDKFKQDMLHEGKQVAEKVKTEATRAANKTSKFLTEADDQSSKSVKKKKS